MLSKKVYLSNLFLLCSVLLSCNNSINKNNIEFTDKKLSKNYVSYTQSDNQVSKNQNQQDEENIQNNNLVNKNEIVQNFEIDINEENNINKTVQTSKGYFNSTPEKETLKDLDNETVNIKNTSKDSGFSIVEKQKLLKFGDKSINIETIDNTSQFKTKTIGNYKNSLADIEIINNLDDQDQKAVIAALEMLSKNNNVSTSQKLINSKSKNKYQLESKIEFSDEKFKIGALIPLTGKNQRIGKEIMAGIENAHFSNFNNNAEIIFFDSNIISENFFYMLANKKLDLIIGPVFTEKIIEINKRSKSINVPVFSFSNNKSLNYQNVWLLGKMQEEEIENIIDFGIKTGVKNFAVFGDDTQYSKTLTRTAEKQLNRKGLYKDVFIITSDILKDRSKLRAKIRKITGWKKENNSKLILPKAKYDGILFTGSKEFILQIAPLLSYYDLGPERAIYLGNSQFKNEQLIKEQSLQGSFFSSSKEVQKNVFTKKWVENWGSKPSFLNTLAHDITNFANEIYFKNDHLNFITRKDGHNWVTGQVFIRNNKFSKREQIINKIQNKNLNEIFLD